MLKYLNCKFKKLDNIDIDLKRVINIYYFYSNDC